MYDKAGPLDSPRLLKRLTQIKLARGSLLKLGTVLRPKEMTE